ncbi:MAG: AraC family transcriptional regulator [Bacteroidales bacterium]|nr:AraC family transcriptional regulator [Bacteroidales bacterium]
MDEFFEKLPKEAEFCINCLDVDVPCLLVPWHFHPETEIIYVEKGTGTRFVGDHAEPFGEGDIGLTGANLPHVWRSDPVYRENIPGLTTHVLVVHFHDTIFKGPLAVLPEMQGINKLLFESQYGIKFFGSARENIKLRMEEMMKTTGIEKILRLIGILDFMSKTEEKQLLASTGYSKIRKSADFNRFDKVHRFMIENFQGSISLESVADIIGMTPTSFCRYFKKHTSKSFHTVLNEIRIGHACKLLIENKMNISGICYESGFSNVSNFNEQFKKIKGYSPSQFIKHRQKQA